MKFFIIPIVLLIALAILAFLFRRKHIQEIGRLETEKLQIQNKPIIEEMTKVKQLNMTGETEEKFERWRNEWTEVADVQMPEIDTLLFDVEDMVDRFRFRKATEIEKEIREKIRLCDKKMNNILQELNELIGSEEKNRIEMEKLKEQHRAARKTVLAHQHSFGMTANPLERELEAFNPKFQEYEELTANGNYLLAREIVITLSAQGERLFTLIRDIPLLLSELQSKIPASIRELRNGIREMEGQSYYLEHLGLLNHLDTIETELQELLEKMATLEVEFVQQRVIDINDRIESCYDMLEKEVTAKHYVEEYYDRVAGKLTSIIMEARETSNEAIYVQQSYRIDESEAQIPQQSLKKLEILESRFEVLTTRLEGQTSAFTGLQDELESIFEELAKISEEQESFTNRLENLRLDEKAVRTKLEELSRKLQNAERKLHRGNIPGIPDDMEARLEEADEQIYLVDQCLQEVPLSMALVDSYLENAEKVVQEVNDKIEELIENVMLTEWIIQYGNRYRATHPDMHERLLDAEESFRQFRYTKALEEAATAVEEVEPGAMKKIQELVKEQV
ncbi:septation ring formation regulator EzrA [Sporosarcina sp. HYO08]|uniref:septation ring formation regulator EzrA n=1 Tax=Sporosarcina sp. HYO08 TaxID=1759557 RepID=UPI0007954B02|nr:septation ring formation regulator EzrA [Sporosarcina sp. HYO08]KXH87173.1 selenide, water dikinase [Sporosarcina sp. HYO08]